MTILEAIKARHTVRAYKEQPLAEDVVRVIEEQIAILNEESQLHIQLVLNEITIVIWYMPKEGSP